MLIVAVKYLKAVFHWTAMLVVVELYHFCCQFAKCDIL